MISRLPISCYNPSRAGSELDEECSGGMSGESLTLVLISIPLCRRSENQTHHSWPVTHGEDDTTKERGRGWPYIILMQLLLHLNYLKPRRNSTIWSAILDALVRPQILALTHFRQLLLVLLNTMIQPFSLPLQNQHVIVPPPNCQNFPHFPWASKKKKTRCTFTLDKLQKPMTSIPCGLGGVNQSHLWPSHSFPLRFASVFPTSTPHLHVPPTPTPHPLLWKTCVQGESWISQLELIKSWS